MGDSEIGRMSRVEATKETVTVPSRVTASDIASEHGIDDSDEEQENVEFRYEKIGVHQFAPTIAEAEAAFADIKKILKPPRKKGHSYEHHGLDELTHSRVEAMRRFLWKYVAGKSTTQWIAASLETARDHERGPYHARLLREWTRAFIVNRNNLPKNIYGTWKTSMLDDEDFAQAIHLHLQSLGPWIRGQDVVDFVKRPETLTQFGLKKPIKLATATRWLKRLDYRWMTSPGGQYVDGHERKDVVDYRQKTFLPRWMSIEEQTRKWKDDRLEENIQDRPQNRRTVVWFHDESTFYANDRRKLRWVHRNETAVPRPKGEGASLMVADFVSADYGWLRSPDKIEEARVFFKAGKNHEGYFTNEDILNQTTKAMDILNKFYPNEEHMFVFDNATTHTARSDTALSARNMPKGTKAVGEFWGAIVPVLDSDGNQVYQRDENGKLTRKPQKMKVRMDGTFNDGLPQSLYFPDDHPISPGCFKGMAVLLQERGLVKESKLRYECPGFKCKPGMSDCCCRRALYSQPDFVAVESLLETHARVRGFDVLFLPKFHCELNFIEQCWGYAKRKYREFPASPKEADLEKNLLAALEMVSLDKMRRSVNYYFKLLFLNYILTDTHIDPNASCMLTMKVLMVRMLHGHARNTVVTVSFQRHFLLLSINQMLQLHSNVIHHILIDGD